MGSIEIIYLLPQELDQLTKLFDDDCWSSLNRYVDKDKRISLFEKENNHMKTGHDYETKRRVFLDLARKLSLSTKDVQKIFTNSGNSGVSKKITKFMKDREELKSAATIKS